MNIAKRIKMSSQKSGDIFSSNLDNFHSCIGSKISHDRFRPTIELLQCISLEIRLYDRATERTVVLIMKVPNREDGEC